MRITPLDIQNKQFRAARMRGYNADDVDAFLDELAAAIDEASRENEALKNQLKDSHQTVAGYDDLKETLNAAIINAQMLANEIKAKAQADADQVVAEANRRAQQIESEAYGRQTGLIASIERLGQAEEQFRNRFSAVLAEFQQKLQEQPSLIPEDVVADERALGQQYAPAAPEPVAETFQPELVAEPQAAAEPEASYQGEPQAYDDAQTQFAPAQEPEQEIQQDIQVASISADSADVTSGGTPRHLAVGEEFPSEEAPAEDSSMAAEPQTESVPLDTDYNYEAPQEEPSFESGYAVPTIGMDEAPSSEYEDAAPAAEYSSDVPSVSLDAEAPVVPAPEEFKAAPEETASRVADDLASKDEIAEAVERMRRMLGEAGIEEPEKAAPAGQDAANIFSPGATEPEDGFGDLGEGVPGARKRREPASDSHSEVD